jgi:LPS O-antigen subunit length determinant protein (WzzB/FepE family)
MEWYSPELAADWANRTVDMVNERLRTQAIDNANRSIQYLNNELSKATAVALQQAIYRLIEEQINDAMLSNVQRDYAFHIIDRAVAPDLKSGPRRTAITIIGAFVGLLLGLAIVFVRYMMRDSRGVTAPTG